MVQFNVKPLPVVVILVIVILFGAYRYGSLNRWKLVNQDRPSDTFPEKKTGERTSHEVTGDDILEFFKIPDRDGMKITWAHKTNQLQQLDSALSDESVLMIEADIRLKTAENTPVMAHGESDIVTSDLITFKEWLKKVIDSKTAKGIKLDIKETTALEPTLLILRSFEESLKIPVVINSDVVPGPNMKSSDVDAKIFFDKTKEIFPHCTLSAGWSTDYKKDAKNEYYTEEMMGAMTTFSKEWDGYITFPVRASLATEKSVESLKTLLNKSDKYSLTVWQHNMEEDVKISDLLPIRKTFTHSRVFYDLPQKLMQEFQNALKNE